MPSKEKIKKPKKLKQKQKQKQKQSIVININSNNKKAASSKAPAKTSGSGPGQPNIPNTPTPQYITRGMPPTINQPPGPPGQPGPAPDMSRILSGMAEMNANFSGIGNLNNVIRGMNDRQSAMESRLTQQYGLQNDFNNDQAHFNNQARNFFTNNPSHVFNPCINLLD